MPSACRCCAFLSLTGVAGGVTDEARFRGALPGLACCLELCEGPTHLVAALAWRRTVVIIST